MHEQKAYITGPITGVENYVANFEAAETEVLLMGFTPVNPVNLNHNHDKSWLAYMREDIPAMLKCDVVYAIKDWQNSKGAGIEVSLALALGLPVIYQPGALVIQYNSRDFNSLIQ